MSGRRDPATSDDVDAGTPSGAAATWAAEPAIADDRIREATGRGWDEWRALLDDREAVFPGTATELRSRPESTSLRIAFPEGVALLSLEPATKGRTKVTIQHSKLSSPQAAERMKEFWTAWLTTLADA